MTTTAVVLVIPSCITRLPPAHKGTEGFIGNRLEHHVKVAGHHTETEKLYWKLAFGNGEQVEKGAIVLIFVKHSGAAVAPVEDMIRIGAMLSTRWAGHLLMRQPGETKVKWVPVLFSALSIRSGWYSSRWIG